MTSNEQHERFLALVDQFDIPVFVIDETGEFEYVSSELTDFATSKADSAVEADGLVGRTVEGVVSDGDVDELSSVLDGSEERTDSVVFSFEQWDWTDQEFDFRTVNGAVLGYPSSVTSVQDGRTGSDAEVLEQLHEVTNRLYAAESISEGHEIVIDAAVEVLGFDWCLLVEAKGDMFEVQATSPESPLEVGANPLATDEGLVGAAYQSGEPLFKPYAEESDVARPTHDFIRSSITVPVGSWGVFQAHSTEPGAFDEQDQQLAETLIAPLATMIERVERENELRGSNEALERQRRQIESLHTVATKMKAATTRSEVYERTIEAVEEILEFDICIIDEAEGDVLVPQAVGSNMSLEDYYEETPIDESDNLGSLTYRKSESFVVDNLHEAGYAPAQSDFTSAISLPLGDWGLFQIASEEEAAFDRTDRRFAELLTEHAVAAIDRIDREQELERRTEELQAQNDRLDEFASIVSHDLRNPLNVASLRTEHALRTGDTDSLEAAGDALGRMESIIEDVLTLARQGESIEGTDAVDLQFLANRCWKQVPDNGATLTVTEAIEIEADERRLGHLFENLFRNAVEHGSKNPDDQSRKDDSSSDSGQERESAFEQHSTDVRIEVGPLPDSEGFYVEDDGPGIDRERRDQVFERGYTKSESGTGLGLAIVKEVVDAHGWEIRVTEGEMGGARFEVTGVTVR